jgi:hypothetical protein
MTLPAEICQVFDLHPDKKAQSRTRSKLKPAIRRQQAQPVSNPSHAESIMYKRILVAVDGSNASRTLSRFQNRGLIDTQGKFIRIVDLEGPRHR